MTNHGDDCFFFYYSTCIKGDSCPFRHCEAAMGSEVVCTLWQEGHCFRSICKFRHMEITKNRKEISCYWENQPVGCQKPHCAFFHEKPRYIDGIFVPPDKSLSKQEEQPQEEPAPLPAATLPTTANPQLRGVIKTETQEPVPSPTHPPVVINPADDDEDEDDQYSESEDGKVGSSPKKLPKSGDSLNFGVSTLEEIRLRKALKASMKRAGYPIQSAETPANGEKENIQSFFRTSLYKAGDGTAVFEEAGTPGGSVIERLGRKLPNTAVKSEGVPFRRGLAGRLGRVVDEDELLTPPQKALKPIKDRLGSPVYVAPAQPADTNMGSRNAPEQIRIKTLEEIRKDKVAKSQSQKEDPSVKAPEISRTKTTKGFKRSVTVKDESSNHVKTFSEIICAKKKRQEEEEQKSSAKKTKFTVEEGPGKSQGELNPAGPEATSIEQVRVKTLEEIRREKAAKLQAQQALEAEKTKSTDTEQSSVKKPRLLQVKKLGSQADNLTTEKSAEVMEKPVKTVAAPEARAASSNSVKVKTFEEIMREKRLRKLEMEAQAKASAEAKPAQKQAEEGTLKRKLPAVVSVTCPGSSSPSSTTLAPDSTPSTPKLPVGKLIPVKPKAASPLKSTSPAGKAATSFPASQSASPLEAEAESSSQSPRRCREVPDKSPAKRTRAAPRAPAAGAPTADKALSSSVKKCPEDAADTKVRPKLNVKPSVMKPAMQVTAGHKRRGAERSAVAAVKPLNSTSSVLEEPCREPQEFPEAQLSSAVPCNPNSLLDSGSRSSPLREDLQTVPVLKASLSQEAKMAVSAAAAREACAVPQSPVLKTPTQPKSRRLSAATSRSASTSTAAASTSAVDDFEELINEFTDDHLEEDMDPGIEEDDLLQELSEMIDS